MPQLPARPVKISGTAVTSATSFVRNALDKRILWSVLLIEVALFLLPDNGAIEGVSAKYWRGVELRLVSSKYWAFAILSGLCVALLLIGLIAFSNYMSRFVVPPSTKNRRDSRRKD